MRADGRDVAVGLDDRVRQQAFLLGPVDDATATAARRLAFEEVTDDIELFVQSHDEAPLPVPLAQAAAADWAGAGLWVQVDFATLITSSGASHSWLLRQPSYASHPAPVQPNPTSFAHSPA